MCHQWIDKDGRHLHSMCHLIILHKGSMFNVNRIGSSTEPCGTHWLTSLCKQYSSFTIRNIWFNLCSTIPLIPMVCSNLCSKILWSVVLNAERRSTRTSKEVSLLSEVISGSLVTFTILLLYNHWIPLNFITTLNLSI